jgi:truncated hemoglobin YjbI
MSTTLPDELRHRGGLVLEAPPDVWTDLGGQGGVEALIADLYARMSRDDLLRDVFPHFNAGAAAGFFVQWFGGNRTYSDSLEGGLIRRHQHRHVSPAAADAWLRCMREALAARDLSPEPILQPLSRIAAAMTHSPNTPASRLRKSCDAIQDEDQVRHRDLLAAAAKGRTDEVNGALKERPQLAGMRGEHGRNLVWIATYRNRPAILACALDAGGDPNAPGCDPLRATMACDIVHAGTGVSVTPLALARKSRPALVAPLLEHGAKHDPFTAAWLGDTSALERYLNTNPELLDAVDPADDYQEVTLLAHAVCGGSSGCVRLLVDRGAEVRRHSGKLLYLAVTADRADLVALLIDHGADVSRVDSMGRLDDANRPVADLLHAHGKRPPTWMLPYACRADVSRNELHRVRVLLDYGADVSDRGRYGRTALHYAVRGGKLPLIELLLERGADPNALDNQGRTPMTHLAKVVPPEY